MTCEGRARGRPRTRWIGWTGCLVLLLLVLGPTSAGGRTLAVSPVTVEVLGVGTVTSNPEGIVCGNGKATCYLAFSGGGTATLTATPASGWSFDSWSGCPAPSGATCQVPIDGTSYEVTANFVGPPTPTQILSVATAGSGNVSGGGIDCGSSPAGTACSWTVLHGSTVTLHETPAAGNVFTGWGGACSGTGTTCTVAMNADRTVSAEWVSSSGVLLSVSVAGSGTVKGGGIVCPSKCSAAEAPNSTVVLTAQPAEGYAFTAWSGACSGTAPTCSVLMDAAQSVTATFEQTVDLNVSVNGPGNVSGGSGAINCGNNGTICSASFAPGDTISLTAAPAVGAAFVGWSGACGGSALTCTVLMSSARSLTATFTTNAVPLTVSVIGPGTVTGGGISCGNGSSTCTANEALNSSVTLAATPATGATFDGWGGACSGTASTCTVSMSAARTVSASFSQSSNASLTVDVSGPGRVTGGGISCGNGATTCSVSLALNSTVTLVETPASGATFSGWGGACSGTATTCTVTMTAARDVSALFSGGATTTLTITVVGRGAVSSTAGTCTGSGPRKTCVERPATGATVALTATPAAGARFSRWSGACAGGKRTCTVLLDTARALTATFVRVPVLTRLSAPRVRKVRGGFRVTLRFRTTQSGIARVRALRAGRVVASLSRPVRAGRVTLASLHVSRAGIYTFQARLGGSAISWRVCVGRC